MNYEDAMEWSTALESGNYKQTRGRLKRDDGFCCWGVLCEIKGMKPELMEDGSYRYAGIHLVSPPTSILKTIGVSVDTDIDLASMNDSGSGFPEIAKHIRDNWQSL
jgi:hypothetical protein